MHTQILPATQAAIGETSLAEAARILKGGGIVALPTETVYGLAASALDERAVAKIFAAKGRPQDNPLIVHIAQPSMLDALAREVPKSAWQLAAAFWPGPLTMVLKKKQCVPDIVSAGLDTVGIRLPDHPVMRAVIERSQTPLAAPSANRSGAPSPTCANDCIEDLSGRVDAIVDGGACPVGVESTVVSLVGDTPRLLRPGAVTIEDLERVLGPVELDSAVTGEADPCNEASAPGMKYRHYAPEATVRLLLGDSEKFCKYVNEHAGPGVMALCFMGEEQKLLPPALSLGDEQDFDTIARRLFGALRELDRKGAKTVYAHCPPPTGVGLAIYNRLIRAAAFDVITL